MRILNKNKWKFKFFTFLALCLFVISSCQKEELVEENASNIIDISDSDITYSKPNEGILENRLGCPSFSNKHLGSCHPPAGELSNCNYNDCSYKGFVILKTEYDVLVKKYKYTIQEYWGPNCAITVTYYKFPCPQASTPCGRIATQELNNETMQALSFLLGSFEGEVSKKIVQIIIKNHHELTSLIKENEETQRSLEEFWASNRKILELSFHANEESNRVIQRANIESCDKVLMSLQKHTTTNDLVTSIDFIREHLNTLEGKSIQEGLKTFDDLPIKEFPLDY